MSEKDKYNQAFDLKDDERYVEAIKLFLSLLKDKRNLINDLEIYSQIATCYYFNGNHKKASAYFTKSQNINDSIEHLSLGKYLSLVRLKKTEEAVNELSRFASKYPIILYRDTLEELVDEMKEGRALFFKDVVFSIAKKHNVHLPPLSATKKNDE